MQAVISLIAASGMRIGEALALDRGDVDLDGAVLTVIGKNDQTRMVPVHPTTAAMLAAYAARRDHLCPETICPSFFLTTHRPSGAAKRDAAHLRENAGTGRNPDTARAAPAQNPRSAAHVRGYQFDPLVPGRRRRCDAHLPVLSTYLGHASPEATYWYLQAAPQLLALAAQRLEDTQPRAPRPAHHARGDGIMTALPPLLQAFFTERLMTQYGASPHTIASYRDTFKLLLGLHSPADRQAPRPGWTWPTWTPPRSVASCNTWRPSAATASPPATPDWRRSTHCSATPAFRHRNTQT